MVWRQELETKLDGGVVSLTVQADGCELLAGTQEGSVYRLLMADLSASKASAAAERTYIWRLGRCLTDDMQGGWLLGGFFALCTSNRFWGCRYFI